MALEHGSAAHAHVLLSRPPLPAHPHLKRSLESVHIASDGGINSAASKFAHIVDHRRTVRNYGAPSASSAKRLVRKRAKTQTKPEVPAALPQPPAKSASASLAADRGASMLVTSDGRSTRMQVYNQSSAGVTPQGDRNKPIRPRSAAFALPAKNLVRSHKQKKTQPAVSAFAHQVPAVPAAPVVAPPADQPSSSTDILQTAFNFVTSVFAVIGLLVFFGFVFIHLAQSRGDDSLQGDVDILSPKTSAKADRRQLPPRVKALRVSMMNSQKRSAHDIEELKKDLRDAGVGLHASQRTRGVQDLFKEVQSGTCGVQWVNDPMKGRRLIRLVRLFRGLVTLHSDERGASVLVEESRSKLNATDGTTDIYEIRKPVTLKLRLDEEDPLEQGEAFMANRLDMPKRWQDKYLKLESDASFSYVEEVDSKHYPGLATWYWVEEWLFRIDLSGVPDEDCHVLGNLDQQEFTTTCPGDNDQEVTHTWKWLPQCAVAKAHWKQGKSLPLGDFRAAQRQCRASGDESSAIGRASVVGKTRSSVREGSVNRSGRYSLARSQSQSSRRSQAHGRARSMTRQETGEECI